MRTPWALGLVLLVLIAPAVPTVPGTPDAPAPAAAEALTAAPPAAVPDVLRALCDATGLLPADECTLQYDGGHHGDASDRCEEPFPPLHPGERSSGMVFPVDDPRDAFLLHLEPGRLHVLTASAAKGATATAALTIAVYAPDDRGPCATPILFAQLTSEPQEFELAGEGPHSVVIEPAKDVTGGGRAGCHSVCLGAVNTAFGYALTVS